MLTNKSAEIVRNVRRLVLPSRIATFHEDYRFVLPAIAWMIGPDGDFRVSCGWWRWHIEIVWQNGWLTGTPRAAGAGDASSHRRHPEHGAEPPSSAVNGRTPCSPAQPAARAFDYRATHHSPASAPANGEADVRRSRNVLPLVRDSL